MKKLGLLLLAATVALVPAQADPLRVDLVISYLLPTLLPSPPPIFQGSNLSGTASFFKQSTTSDLNVLIPGGPPITSETLREGRVSRLRF